MYKNYRARAAPCSVSVTVVSLSVGCGVEPWTHVSLSVALSLSLLTPQPLISAHCPLSYGAHHPIYRVISHTARAYMCVCVRM